MIIEMEIPNDVEIPANYNIEIFNDQFVEQSFENEYHRELENQLIEEYYWLYVTNGHSYD